MHFPYFPTGYIPFILLQSHTMYVVMYHTLHPPS